ncbi:unnamed protein product [Alternaria alternata]
MQSMFRLPWCNESPGDKIMEKSTLHKSRPLPVVDMPHFMNKIKRKRTDSPEPVMKKWKGAHGEIRAVNGNANAKAAAENERPADAPKAPAEVLDVRPKAQPSRKRGRQQEQGIEIFATDHQI